MDELELDEGVKIAMAKKLWETLITRNVVEEEMFRLEEAATAMKRRKDKINATIKNMQTILNECSFDYRNECPLCGAKDEDPKNAFHGINHKDDCKWKQNQKSRDFTMEAITKADALYQATAISDIRNGCEAVSNYWQIRMEMGVDLRP
jgi:hypothetical protein